MWMSSSAREKAKPPAAISDITVSRPSRIASASLTLTMPVAPSMAAWARLASMSWAARRLSKSIEALIACMTASGPAAKRPPHIALDSLLSFIPSTRIAAAGPAIRRAHGLRQPGPRHAADPGRPRGAAGRRDAQARGDRPAGARRRASLRRPPRQGGDAGRQQRPHPAGELLGHLVRALPPRDAGARRAGPRTRRRRFRGRSRSPPAATAPTPSPRSPPKPASPTCRPTSIPRASSPAR